MSKYTRHQPVVIRESDSSNSEDNWMNQLAKNLEKISVEPAKNKSIYDQITAVMNKKSKFPTVEAAVLDMQERSGLLAYRSKIKMSEVEDVSNLKVASDDLPNLLKKTPYIKNTIENYITETRGNATVPAILEKIREIHRSDVSDSSDWESEDLLRYISNRNVEEKKKHPQSNSEYMNLGRVPRLQDSEVDQSNTDAFFALMPATK